MQVVLAASEAVPFCKTGGLADVAGALARELARMGLRVTLFVPYYRAVRQATASTEPLPGKISVRLGDRTVEARLLRASTGSAEALLVDCPEFYDRAQLYMQGGADYEDNARRFAFFCRAVLEGSRLAGLKPDVFHCHDWQTGLLPVYLRTLYRSDPDLGGAATVFTIHNLAYQGCFAPDSLAGLDLPSDGRVSHFGRVSYLKSGLAFSDVLNTVSPTYAEEIRTPERGLGLDAVLRERGDVLFGVLNGLEVELWDPETDPHLPRRYGRGDFPAGKAACKAALQAEAGLEVRPDVMLVGSVSRLDAQKGVDLALDSLPRILERGAQFVLIGNGDPAMERRASEFARRHPARVHYRADFDEPFAHRVYAAADAFLMPSRFEPCGLGQMIALRYGAVPVSVRTGGLADTIGAEGFSVPQASAEAVGAGLSSCLASFGETDRRPWEERVRAGMGRDFSWRISAERYLGLYAEALKRADDGSPV
ncbi:MAG: glycogen/starch synthase [Elusimicrobiota bacterium]